MIKKLHSDVQRLNSDFGKSFVFGNFKASLRQHFLKAGINSVPYAFFGVLFWISLVPTVVLFFLAWPFVSSIFTFFLADFLVAFVCWAAIHVSMIVVLFFMGYVYTKILIFNRVSRMEQVLPSFLRMVSENLQGGMNFENALWNSLSHDFGVLAYEMRLSAKKVITGSSPEDALKSFTSKYDSKLIQRSFDLIIEGMKSGVKLALVIDKIVLSIEESKRLKDEMAATNLSYVIFIGLIVVVITPGLFTLGFQFLGILESVGEKIGDANLDDSSVSGIAPVISLDELAISPNQFRDFSIMAISVIGFFSSLMISLIQRGNILGGIVYIPFVILGALFFYFVFMNVADAVFGGLSI